MIVTIDGPAGTGKTTVARGVAKQLHFPYCDTGAMYRAITWAFLQNEISLTDAQAIEKLLRNFPFRIEEGEQVRYFVGDVDVSEEIRSKEVTSHVSAVSALLPVREHAWKLQRAFAETHQHSVFEGRDMGSVVFPHAEVKIFLTAPPEVRAKRRLEELIKKAKEKEWTQEKMVEEIKRRDTFDSGREIAPLKMPEGAHVLDTSGLSLDQVIEAVISYVKKSYPYRKGNWLYRTILSMAKLFLRGIYRHRVYGLEHFHPGGAIIASNHASYLDPPISAISSPEEVHFLAKADLFKIPVFSSLIRALNSHPVSGDVGDIGVFKLLCQLLKEGKKIVLFPEGSREEKDELEPLKPGIGMLISRTNTFILPLYIHGTFKIWNKFRKLPKLGGKTASVFGSPIHYASFAHLGKREAHEAIAQRLFEALSALRAWYEAGAHGTPP